MTTTALEDIFCGTSEPIPRKTLFAPPPCKVIPEAGLFYQPNLFHGFTSINLFLFTDDVTCSNGVCYWRTMHSRSFLIPVFNIFIGIVNISFILLLLLFLLLFILPLLYYYYYYIITITIISLRPETSPFMPHDGWKFTPNLDRQATYSYSTQNVLTSTVLEKFAYFWFQPSEIHYSWCGPVTVAFNSHNWGVTWYFQYFQNRIGNNGLT